MGFIARNDASLVRVPDWPEFCAWAKEAGHGEEVLDINDSRCLALQEAFLEETHEVLLAGERAR
ncbi:MAG: hypothetical protein AB1899_10545 [Pseudomonadota bacterium]